MGKKHGTIKSGGGYLAIEAPEGYPGVVFNRGHYAAEHRVVWWRAYGVLPEKGEVIHHKNGDRYDNRLENLELMKNSEHSKLHSSRRVPAIAQLTCDYCSKVFQRHRRRLVKGAKHYYCSKACAGHGMAIARGNAQVSITCRCSVIFQLFPSRIRRNLKRGQKEAFCSRMCAAKARVV